MTVEPTPAPEGDELLSRTAAARLVGVKPPNFYAWAHVRGLEPYCEDPRPLGKRWLRSALEAARDAWLASGGDSPGGREADEKRRAALQRDA